MGHNPHEDRVAERLRFIVGDSEVAQELSMPRKTRRLDFVCHFQEPPALFGSLATHCRERLVIIEHESRPLQPHTIARALLGQAWLAWEQLRPAEKRRHASTAQRITRGARRPPIAIVLAHRPATDLSGAIPGLRPDPTPGLWKTPHLDEGGLLVLCTDQLPKQEGLTFWRWLNSGRDPLDARARLFDLLGDRSFPTLLLEQLMEAAMEERIAVTTEEREGLYQRLKRELLAEGRAEGREEGRAAGREEGQQVGERKALLGVARAAAPDELPRLEAIDDIDALRDAVLRLVAR